jgi:hypothetical protein
MTSKTNAIVYLIPTTLDEQAIGVIPFYVLDAVKNCQVFFTGSTTTNGLRSIKPKNR